MSRTESWKTWAAVIVVLVAFGLFAALWPSISNVLGSGTLVQGPRTRLPNETQPIVLEVPTTISMPGIPIPTGGSIDGPVFAISVPEIVIPGVMEAGGQTIVFIQPLFAILLLTVVVVGSVVVIGAIFAGLYVLVSKWVVRTKTSDSYQEHQANLDNKAKEELKVKREGRAAAPPPDDQRMPRWSIISTSLIILMFVIFGGMVLTSTFFPERVVTVGEDILRPAVIIVGIPLIITVAILVFAPRWGTAALSLIILFFVALITFAVMGILGLTETQPLSTLLSIMFLIQIGALILLAYIWRPTPSAKIEEIVEHAEETGREKGIPYDGIAVLISGLVVVGLGLGLLLIVNSEFNETVQQTYEQVRLLLGF